MNKKLLIIDGNSLAHRAFHALPPLATKEGKPAGAVYGFLLVFFRVLKEINPSFVVAAFDVPGPTFRHEEFKMYKATRPKTAPELSIQLSKIKEALAAFSVPLFEKEKFEADDLIGAISRIVSKKQILPEMEIVILTGDKDLLQLVDRNVKVHLLGRGVKNATLYDIEKVKEKYEGLTPNQLVDYKGLRGDPSDNISGVLGIGEKTGLKLIRTFGNLEVLYEELEKDTARAKEVKGRIRDALLNHKEDAFFSRKLAQIKWNIPLDFNLDDCYFGNYRKEKVKNFLEKMEFYSLIDKIPDPRSLDKA